MFALAVTPLHGTEPALPAVSAEVAVLALPLMLIPAVPALILAAVKFVNPAPPPLNEPVNELPALLRVTAFV